MSIKPIQEGSNLVNMNKKTELQNGQAYNKSSILPSPSKRLGPTHSIIYCIEEW